MSSLITNNDNSNDNCNNWRMLALFRLLDNNAITDLAAGAFEGLRNLQEVTLYGNPLATVHELVFTFLPALTSM